MSDVITLSTARSRLMIEPRGGCVATSWLVDGSEVLALPAPLEAFLASARTGGIPLLYPWANRLRAARFQAAGRTVDLSSVPNLKRDGNGLPMHGLLLRW
jgi:galactose mutarotase-like enzyme